MATLLRPGVTLKEARRVPAPRARPSSVTGFVGLSHSGPIGSAQRLDSWDLYREIFGRADDEAGALGPSVRGFFLNGGRACYAVRVERPDGDPLAPTAASYVLRMAAGMNVLVFTALNPGAWGGLLGLSLSPSVDRIELTRTTAPTSGGLDVVSVGSTFDLVAGQPVTLVSGLDDRVVFRQPIVAVGPGLTIRMALPLPFDLPENSAVIGSGLDLEIRHGQRVERFPAVSLDPNHPRWVVTMINGDDPVLSYAEKVANGASILARCSAVGVMSLPLPRPREGVDVPLATGVLAALPTGVRPDQIAPWLRFEPLANQLYLEAHMTSRTRDALLALNSTDLAWAVAVLDLYDRQPFGELAPGSDGTAPTDIRLYVGSDGATYFPSSNPSSGGYSGVAALELAEDVSLVAVPDLHRGTDNAPGGADPFLFGQQEILRHCEKMGERLAVLDAPDPPSDLGLTTREQRARWLREDYVERIGSHAAAVNGALYYPRLLVSRNPADPPAAESSPLPPSGYVAGLMARTDELEGVHRAPANEVMEGVIALATEIDDDAHCEFNEANVNVLRSIRGRGIRVLGARILARDSVSRTVPVRRVILAVKRELRESLGWTVFEPNSSQLRRRVHSAVESYLDGLFRTGVLAGATPEDAYFVRSADATTPSQLLVELGLAPVAPAEFIVATIMRSADFLDVRIAE